MIDYSRNTPEDEPIASAERQEHAPVSENPYTAQQDMELAVITTVSFSGFTALTVWAVLLGTTEYSSDTVSLIAAGVVVGTGTVMSGIYAVANRYDRRTRQI